MSQPFDNRDYDLEQLAKKDTEIQRLKAELEIEKRHWVEDDRDLHELCDLIVELCDALERIPIMLTPPDRELVERARKVTR